MRFSQKNAKLFPRQTERQRKANIHPMMRFIDCVITTVIAAFEAENDRICENIYIIIIGIRQWGIADVSIKTFTQPLKLLNLQKL